MRERWRSQIPLWLRNHLRIPKAAYMCSRGVQLGTKNSASRLFAPPPGKLHSIHELTVQNEILPIGAVVEHAHLSSKFRFCEFHLILHCVVNE